MANSLTPVLKQKFFANNGKPAAGYKVFTYAAGTDTKVDTYQSANGAANANPITLDFRGEANIWVPPNVAYKFVFSPPNDTDPPTNPIWTIDGVVDSQLVTLWGGVDTGIANAYVLNFTANFTSYTDGIVIYWIPSNTNTGPSTINVNGLGPVPITNQDGSALYLGQLQANQVALIVYRSTGFTLVATALLPLINTENSNYEFQLGDANNIVMHTDNVTPHTWTIATNATVPFAVATSIQVINQSSQNVTISGAVGVTLYVFGRGSLIGGNITLSPGTSCFLTKTATNTWQQSTQTDVVYIEALATGTIQGVTVVTIANILFHRIAGLMTLSVATAQTATSNTNALSITGLPAAIRPTADRTVSCAAIVDNGAAKGGWATISTAGTLTLGLGIDGTGTFTSSGAKGLGAGWTITYPL